MDLADISARDLQAVIAVASHGHFGRAAAALRMAQSTLSARVLKVEGALGTDIFERTGRSFLVTAEGERLLPLLREVVAANDRLASAAAESRGALGGGVRGSRKKLGKSNGAGGAERFIAPPLRVGAIPTLGPYLIPHLLLPLRKELPELTLELSEQPTARLIEELQEGLLDAALLSFPIRAETLEVLPLFEEPFRLLGAKGCPLLTGPRPTVGMLNASEMLLLEEGHCLRDQALALCRPRGSARRAVTSAVSSAAPDGRAKVLATSLETLKYLVAASASDGTQPGYTLVPLLAAGLPRGLEDLVRVRAFEGEDTKGGHPSRRIGLCIRRTFTRRAEAEKLAAFIRGHLPAGVRKLDR